MHRTAALKGFTFDSKFEGMVKSYHSLTTGRPCVRPRQIIAHMFLNNRGIRSRGAEILCHECVHAGMAWARLRKANLSKMPGEEIMCYATGRMHEQLVSIVHMLKIW